MHFFRLRLVIHNRWRDIGLTNHMTNLPTLRRYNNGEGLVGLPSHSASMAGGSSTALPPQIELPQFHSRIRVLPVAVVSAKIGSLLPLFLDRIPLCSTEHVVAKQGDVPIAATILKNTRSSNDRYAKIQSRVGGCIRSFWPLLGTRAIVHTRVGGMLWRSNAHMDFLGIQIETRCLRR